jgi:uncharacterized membrane protein
MQITTKTSRASWITPATGVVIGLVYLFALIGAVGGLTYLGAVGYFRLRG